MYTCSTCSNTYSNEPFRWHGGDGFYCSENCLPIGTLDEHEALSYTGLLEYYRSLMEEPFICKTRKERGELLFEVNDLHDCVMPFLMEDGENFYCRELQELYDKVCILQQTWEAI